MTGWCTWLKTPAPNGALAEADQVYIAPNATNLVMTTNADPVSVSRDSLWWVSDQGVRYGIELDDSALKPLRIATAAARQAPWVLIRTFAPGPALSRETRSLSTTPWHRSAGAEAATDKSPLTRKDAVNPGARKVARISRIPADRIKNMTERPDHEFDENAPRPHPPADTAGSPAEHPGAGAVSRQPWSGARATGCRLWRISAARWAFPLGLARPPRCGLPRGHRLPELTPHRRHRVHTAPTRRPVRHRGRCGRCRCRRTLRGLIAPRTRVMSLPRM